MRYATNFGMELAIIIVVTMSIEVQKTREKYCKNQSLTYHIDT